MSVLCKLSVVNFLIIFLLVYQTVDIISSPYGKPVGHCLLLIAHWLLLIACKSKVGAQLIHFFVFPVSNAKDSQSMIITVIIGHLPDRCSSTTTRHHVSTAHPNSVHIINIFVHIPYISRTKF